MKTTRKWCSIARRAGVAQLLGIVIMVLFAGFAGGLARSQESARRTSCLNNIRQLELALIQYAGEYNDEYPSPLKDKEEPAQKRFERLLTLNYLNAPKVFHCPSAGFKARPDVKKLNGMTITDPGLELGTVAQVYLDVDWCSYGIDPTVQHTMGASRAVVADKPHHDYFGTGVSSPGAGKAGSNSENHDGLGQNIAYNDGHVKWAKDCRDDSGIDPNIYGVNPDVNVDDDSNIDFGAKPAKEAKK